MYAQTPTAVEARTRDAARRNEKRPGERSPGPIVVGLTRGQLVLSAFSALPYFTEQP